jgi:hypothetical protein
MVHRRYKIQPHVYGITARKVLYLYALAHPTSAESTTFTYSDCSGTLAATFGASAGAFAIFFFGEVPRVKK